MGEILLERYRTSKPNDGIFSFELHGGAVVIGFTEYWHTTKGWEVNVDVIVDTAEPRERRYFMVAAGGYNLTALGEYAAHYHVATYINKGYAAYLFDITHLSETERDVIRTYPERLKRARPPAEELSYKQRHHGQRRHDTEPDSWRAARAGGHSNGG